MSELGRSTSHSWILKALLIDLPKTQWTIKSTRHRLLLVVFQITWSTGINLSMMMAAPTVVNVFRVEALS